MCLCMCASVCIYACVLVYLSVCIYECISLYVFMSVSVSVWCKQDLALRQLESVGPTGLEPGSSMQVAQTSTLP